MLSALSWMLKLTLFTIAVLIAGEWIRWDGRTLAQHVMFGVGRAEKSDAIDSAAGYVKDLARKITEDARSGFEKKAKSPGRRSAAAKDPAGDAQEEAITDRTEMRAAAPMEAPNANAAGAQSARAAATRSSEERLPPSERQKLKALIQELNGPGE
jgi:hypothetical protein